MKTDKLSVMYTLSSSKIMTIKVYCFLFIIKNDKWFFFYLYLLRRWWRLRDIITTCHFLCCKWGRTNKLSTLLHRASRSILKKEYFNHEATLTWTWMYARKKYIYRERNILQSHEKTQSFDGVGVDNLRRNLHNI